MSDVLNRVRGAVTFECRLIRIEAYASASTSEDYTHWSIKSYRSGGFHPRGAAIMIGHLAVSSEGDWGQALVQGLLTREKDFPSDSAYRSFVRRYGQGFFEEMYDVARRGLNANSALLDGDLDLARSAPPAIPTFMPSLEEQQERLPDQS